MKRFLFVLSLSTLLLGGFVSMLFFSKNTNNIYLTGQWILWLYIIVFLPFRLFDFYRQKNKILFGYILNVIALILGIVALYYLITYKIKGPLIPTNLNIVLLFLLTFIYIKSTFDVIKRKRQRDLIFLCLLSIALLIIFILSTI
ncbi:MAG: hypothetical protein IJ605_05160 [Prevotella sp.]|nr:hypothetical protein [Prevotella sp.]